MNNLSTNIATTREQSERLQSIGVKSETADCLLQWIIEEDWESYETLTIECWMNSKLMFANESIKPAWSLSRLISMLPSEITVNKKCGSLFISHVDISYFGFESDKRISFITGFTKGADESLFDICIDMIDWLIKNNHFNKEYLR